MKVLENARVVMWIDTLSVLQLFRSCQFITARPDTIWKLFLLSYIKKAVDQDSLRKRGQQLEDRYFGDKVDII